jgi:hypothetical protein
MPGHIRDLTLLLNMPADECHADDAAEREPEQSDANEEFHQATAAQDSHTNVSCR